MIGCTCYRPHNVPWHFDIIRSFLLYASISLHHFLLPAAFSMCFFSLWPYFLLSINTIFWDLKFVTCLPSLFTLPPSPFPADFPPVMLHPIHLKRIMWIFFVLGKTKQKRILKLTCKWPPIKEEGWGRLVSDKFNSLGREFEWHTLFTSTQILVKSMII